MTEEEEKGDLYIEDMGLGLIDATSNRRTLLYSDLSGNLDIDETNSPISKQKQTGDLKTFVRESNKETSSIGDENFLDDELVDTPESYACVDRTFSLDDSGAVIEKKINQPLEKDKKTRLQVDLLHVSIVDVYMQLKVMIRRYVEGKAGSKEEAEIDERES